MAEVKNDMKGSMREIGSDTRLRMCLSVLGCFVFCMEKESLCDCQRCFIARGRERDAIALQDAHIGTHKIHLMERWIKVILTSNYSEYAVGRARTGVLTLNS